jgi:hypothetical protein
MDTIETFFHNVRALDEKNKQSIIVARQLIEKSKERVEHTKQTIERARANLMATYTLKSGPVQQVC